MLVPLNRREEIGVVWDHGADDRVPDRKLKPITAIVDTPPMRPALRQFVDWVASYTLSPPARSWRWHCASSPPRAPPATGWRRALPAPDSPHHRSPPESPGRPGQPANPAPPPTLPAPPASTTGVIRGMADAGLLVPAILPIEPPFAIPNPDYPGTILAPDQATAAAALRAAVAAREFSVTLLDGVTGSGKTETYLEAVAEYPPPTPPGPRPAARNRPLLPMAGALRAPLRRRPRRLAFRPHFPHRRTTWRAVAEGAAPVVVGARSALFLPFPDLGLIVIDEEHETAFKQEEGVVYHARDMAVVRARFCAAPAVLVSATPSLETLANVEAGRYRRLTLPTRHGGAVLPVGRRHRHARHAAGPRPLPRPAADRRRSATRWPAASRPCCSSTAAATRR